MSKLMEESTEGKISKPNIKAKEMGGNKSGSY
jgi:hypothetical protein